MPHSGVWRKMAAPCCTSGRREGALVWWRSSKPTTSKTKGLTPFEANEQLGHQRDARKFDVAAKLLEDLGWAEVRLMTNNPDKVNALRAEGIRVTEVVPIQFEPNEHNAAYLAAKVKEAGGEV